jgi:hypothetical protein
MPACTFGAATGGLRRVLRIWLPPVGLASHAALAPTHGRLTAIRLPYIGERADDARKLSARAGVSLGGRCIFVLRRETRRAHLLRALEERRQRPRPAARIVPPRQERVANREAAYTRHIGTCIAED